ncbi:hypothetical protein [Flammeovirga sp. EKP202]|uniref:hypothetical protein n=1 Tax=Flammeovirga sp. EKP202 TaxID=2770592 RepID=UPI00165FFA69|nr:hypothetical protein [Flammeovirga sp. EKP202]MBD0400146.1 hypothetical protein [Flammeovirga sp. EKP202]
MKNIWKNAILFLSLIGLMTFVSSCSSSDDGGDVIPDVEFNYTADVSATNPAEVNTDFKLAVNVTTTTVTFSGYDSAWPMPEGFKTSMSFTEMLALDWDAESSVSNISTGGDVVTLVYTETTTSSATRTRENDITYTYVFNKDAN